MKIARKLALSLAATALGASFVAFAGPAPAANAQFGDSSWGCGGQCRTAPTP